MPQGNEGQDVRRRRVARRSSAGFAFGGGGISRASDGGVRSDAENPENDEPDLNEAVQQQAVRPPAATQQPSGMQTFAAQEEFTPATMLARVAARSTEEERNYRLELIHRMILRRLPATEIATQLGLSERTIRRDIADLRDRLRQSAKELDIEIMIGHSKGFYEEVQAMALRAASNSQVPMPMRLGAMRTALAAHNDMHRFYQASGVYDVLRFRKGATEAQTDIQRMLSMTTDLLAEARRENRSGDDPLGDFSGGDRENMEL